MNAIDHLVSLGPGRRNRGFACRSRRGLPVALAALLVAGCAQSRFTNDPRAALVGPDYLDYIEQYPRDRDTQYYYPDFTVAGLEGWHSPEEGLTNAAPADIQALLTTLPPVPPSVQSIEGKGWPELERKGMPCFLPQEATH